MNQKWYQTGVVKAVLVILAHISVIMLAVGFVWMISYPALREEIFTGEHAKKYEDTRTFTSEVRDYSFQVVRGISAKPVFETDGNYDEDKIVDLEYLNQNGTVSGKNESGLAYRLGDLVTWSGGMSYTEYEGDNTVIVCRKPDDTFYYYTYSQFRELLESGELEFVFSDNTSVDTDMILDYLTAGMDVKQELDAQFGDGFVQGIRDKEGKTAYENCWGAVMSVVEETYKPIGADSILDLANHNSAWNGRLTEAYNLLQQSITTIGSYYADYAGIEQEIGEGDTNYTYLYANTKTGVVYTNKSGYEKFEELEKNIEEMKSAGKYVVIRSKLKDFESNLKHVDASTWRDEIKLYGEDIYSRNSEDFVFAACVDTTYAIQDNFYKENLQYQKYGKDARLITVAGIGAILLFLVCIVWLAAAAGKNGRDNDIHLHWIDRIPTELAAFLVIILWGVPAFGVYSVTFDSIYNTSGVSFTDNLLPWILAGSALAAFTCAMFLLGVLSLARRLKAHTVWKNSILYRLFRGCRLVFAHMDCAWRVIVGAGIYMVIQLFALMIIASGGNLFGLLLILVADVAAFALLMIKAIGEAQIKKGADRIAAGEVDYKIPTGHTWGSQREIAEKMNSIGDGLDAALEESMKSERLKTDLITNVSHDIKTPLTSIINYVELLKQEDFEDPKIRRYIEVLEAKAQRLKTLTEDVVEASKVSSGNISLEYMELNLVEMIQQTSGEFEEKFSRKRLQEMLTLPDEDVVIRVDGRRTWRILENIYNNAAKYAMEGSRVYADLAVDGTEARFSLKNISEQPLNISADELTERFIRGDISRSTEGSGLGLSIAKTLTEMQGGQFELYLDGDLFKVTITFPRVVHKDL